MISDRPEKTKANERRCDACGSLLLKVIQTWFIDLLKSLQIPVITANLIWDKVAVSLEWISCLNPLGIVLATGKIVIKASAPNWAAKEEG